MLPFRLCAFQRFDPEFKKKKKKKKKKKGFLQYGKIYKRSNSFPFK
jgi:hypothetical protein